MHTHHIVFRSQGGLDFDLNLRRLTPEEHEGTNGLHHNSAVDLMYKMELQNNLDTLFRRECLYTEEQVAKRLGKSVRYWEKNLKKVPRTMGMIRGEDLIRRLMGGKLY